MKLDPKTYRLIEPGRLGPVSLTLGLIGLAASVGGYFVDSPQFFHSYLVAFAFWIAIGLGGLFFTMLHHLVNAHWSTVIRRWAEGAMATLPIMAVFAIPLLLGMHDLYHWSHAEAVAHDEILQAKAGYLNPTFFVIRTIFYFAVWTALAILLHRTSIRQDSEPFEALTLRLRRISGAGMVLFAITTSFAAFDWLMSLDPHWFSTIFGVYWFSGNFLAFMCFIVLLGLYQRRQKVLNDTVTVEHYHDLGKLIFGFIVFWAYMGFSQYFLIWYANIPEETVWFTHRWEGDWKIMSLVLIFGHFALPFVALITRTAKRSLFLLGIVAVWMLIMRWVDTYWLVFPTLYEHGPHLNWIDLATLVGLGGIFVWAFWTRYTAHPAVPVGDPSLEASIKFQNQ